MDLSIFAEFVFFVRVIFLLSLLFFCADWPSIVATRWQLLKAAVDE